MMRIQERGIDCTTRFHRPGHSPRVSPSRQDRQVFAFLASLRDILFILSKFLFGGLPVRVRTQTGGYVTSRAGTARLKNRTYQATGATVSVSTMPTARTRTLAAIPCANVRPDSTEA